MKILYKSILILIAILYVSSCATEDPIKVDPSFILSFQRDGNTKALAGTTFYVLPTGSGEFLTLFNGNEGFVYGVKGSKGEDFNKADSIGVTYPLAGTYKLTLVSTSAAELGKEVIRIEKTVDIVVVDERNTFDEFYINGKKGVISDNEINFTFPDAEILTGIKPVFTLSSPDATVTVDGIPQVSEVTSNNFTQPVVYVVKSKEGKDKSYTVKINLIPSSDEKKVLKFELVGQNGEKGIIDEQNKTIQVAGNYGSNINKTKLAITVSLFSTLSINGAPLSQTKLYNLATIGSGIKVIAQNKTETIYKLNAVAEDPISEFTFLGLIPAPQGIIDKTAKTVTINVLKGTDITKLVTSWKGSVGKVQIGTTVQTNGVTINDFTSPKIYTFYKGTTAGDSYTVTVVEK